MYYCSFFEPCKKKVEFGANRSCACAQNPWSEEPLVGQLLGMSSDKAVGASNSGAAARGAGFVLVSAGRGQPVLGQIVQNNIGGSLRAVGPSTTRVSLPSYLLVL